MTYDVVILYSNDPDDVFDQNYYISRHMPLVAHEWKKYGMIRWFATGFGNNLDGSKPQFAICCVITWETEEGAKAAFQGPEGTKIMKDVSNYSTKPPLFLFGSTLHSSQLS